jgi:ankyrin repeat protein
LNPLTYAIQNQNKEMTLFLLEKGATINPVEYNVSFPLGLAVSGASVDIIHLLLANGADVNDENIGGKTALEYAVERGDESIVRFLLDRGASIDSCSIKAAARDGGLPIATLLMERSGGEEKSMPHGALMQAASEGLEDLVELFLGCDVDPNDTISPIISALHYAMARRHGTVVRMLLDHGAV